MNCPGFLRASNMSVLEVYSSNAILHSSLPADDRKATESLDFKRRVSHVFLLTHSPRTAGHRSFSPGTSRCSSGSQQQHGSGQAAGSYVRSW